MSTYATKSDVSKKLGGNSLIILPDAAESVLEAEPPAEDIIEEIITTCDSGDTVDETTVKNAIAAVGQENTVDNTRAPEHQETKESDNKTDSADADIDDEEQSEESEEITEDDVNRNIDDQNENSDGSSEESLDNSVDNSTAMTRAAQEQTAETVTEGDSIDPKAALQELQQTVDDTKDASQVINRKETLDDRYPAWCNIMFNRDLPDVEPRTGVAESYEIKGDVTGESRGTGDFEDYKSLFADRHERFMGMLNNRAGTTYHVSDINRRRHAGENLTITGLVWDTFTSNNGNYFIELEDANTNETMRVVFTDDDMKDVFEEVVPDEAVAVRGTLSDNGEIIFGDDEVRRGRPPIMFPDTPRNKNRDRRPDQPVEAAFISDIHVGADEFYPDLWTEFVDWVRTTPTVEYVFIAGDAVEGIGVYPDQDEELTVLDIHDQYAMAGRMLEQLPDDVQIFLSVGNHDRVRLAEPQPTLDEEFARHFPDNTEFVGNPVTVNVDGINILMYHGMSINALAEVVPGVNVDPPTETMELMLRKRHLAPVYGKNVRLAPEEKDYLVIDEVPDVLHCGHVHKYASDDYNGVKMVNTATWQGQTSFQKSKGIVPDVGYWSSIDLSTMEVKDMSVDEPPEFE